MMISMTGSGVRGFRLIWAVGILGLGCSVTVAASPPAPAAGQAPKGAEVKTGPISPQADRGPADQDQAKEPVMGDETAGTRNAARTRMRECGHQWSAMKKSGAAQGMTWKEFSQTCLARK